MKKYGSQSITGHFTPSLRGLAGNGTPIFHVRGRPSTETATPSVQRSPVVVHFAQTPSVQRSPVVVHFAQTPSVQRSPVVAHFAQTRSVQRSPVVVHFSNTPCLSDVQEKTSPSRLLLPSHSPASSRVRGSTGSVVKTGLHDQRPVHYRWFSLEIGPEAMDTNDCAVYIQ